MNRLEILDTPALQALRFRRQFILGPRPLDGFPAWQQASVGENLFLQAHPDLELTQATQQQMQLTLLGYLLDPDHPGLQNEDILQGLLARMEAPQDVFKLSTRLAGRWVLIVDNGQETLLFTDPAGLRQVVYTDASLPERWCATQPEVLREALQLEVDEEVAAFVASDHYQRARRTPWLPGDVTLYEGCRHLLPNHYLDLKTWTPHRFWPWEELPLLGFEEGTAASADLLRAIMISANARFPMALAVTAGIDTRTLLAATRDIAGDVLFFAHDYRSKRPASQLGLMAIKKDLAPNHPDITVARRMLARVGHSHHVFPVQVDDYLFPENDLARAFKEIYNGNTDLPHEMWGAISFADYHHFPQDHVYVKGSCSETTRCRYYKKSYPDKINGETLARLANMTAPDPAPLAVWQYETWLEGAKDAAAEHGYEVLDLFHMEHHMGRWQAANQTEMDIVQRAFTPFNNRALLTTTLGIDPKYRKPKGLLRVVDSPLHKEIIRHLWKELLAEPINPQATQKKIEHFKKQLRRKVRSVMQRTGVYALAKKAANVGQS